MVNYDQPTLDWKKTSVPSPQDFNRIEGNIDYLEKNKAALDENGNVVQKAVCIESLTFTGGVTGSYDGSTAKSVAIPTELPTPNALTAGSKTFNGSAPVSIVKSDLGLGNVDNTSDANKPVSMAQLLSKFSKSHYITYLIYRVYIKTAVASIRNRCFAVI